MAGERLLRIARAWFDERIVTSVFEPLLADWQTEHRNRRGLARLLSSMQVCASFATSCLLEMPWQLKSRLPEGVVLGGWIATEAFAVVGAIVQWYLFFDTSRPGATHLLPALLGTSLPLALIPAAFIVSRLGNVVQARTMMARLTLLTMLALLPLLAWFIPNSNQVWRIAQRQPNDWVMRGGREVTLPELFRAAAPADVHMQQSGDWNAFRRDVWLERTSVFFMPITLCVFGLAGARRNRRPVLLMLACWAAGGLTWLTLLDPHPWLAHAVLLGAAAVFNAYDRRSPALAG